MCSPHNLYPFGNAWMIYRPRSPIDSFIFYFICFFFLSSRSKKPDRPDLSFSIHLSKIGKNIIYIYINITFLVLIYYIAGCFTRPLFPCLQRKMYLYFKLKTPRGYGYVLVIKRTKLNLNIFVFFFFLIVNTLFILSLGQWTLSFSKTSQIVFENLIKRAWQVKCI